MSYVFVNHLLLRMFYIILVDIVTTTIPTTATNSAANVTDISTGENTNLDGMKIDIDKSPQTISPLTASLGKSII